MKNKDVQLRKVNNTWATWVIRASFLHEIDGCACRVENNNRLSEEPHVDDITYIGYLDTIPAIAGQDSPY